MYKRQVLKDDNCIIAAAEDCDPWKRKELGSRVLITEKAGDGIDLADLMKKLGEREIDSILLEGGGALNEAALRQGIVDRIVSFIAQMCIRDRQSTFRNTRRKESSLT